MSVHHDLRVQMLGGLVVIRPDGTAVSDHAWRTAKTMDLLRLLALTDGRPVPATSLIDKLWPDVPPERARASLRTASSHIRRAIGSPCVTRTREGLVLEGAVIDVVQLRNIAHRSGQAAADHDNREVVDLARQAEALYRGDFRAQDDDAGWARLEREQLRHLWYQLLCDAGASALALRRQRDALHFARTAVGVDPGSELAHRLLMQAHAAVGEVGSALRVFETYRTHLADELGADPSPQTQALHLQLLRGRLA